MNLEKTFWMYEFSDIKCLSIPQPDVSSNWVALVNHTSREFLSQTIS